MKRKIIFKGEGIEETFIVHKEEWDKIYNIVFKGDKK